MKQAKIAIIGAGAVGSTTAYALMLNQIPANIMLVDTDEQRCKGEVLDLSDALSFCPAATIAQATAKDAGQADIIIVSAGARQKLNQTRIELVDTNKKVLEAIFKSIAPINKQAIILMISNPVDVLTLLAQEINGLPRNQVFGSGTFIDSNRLRNYLAQKLDIAEQSIHAYVLGEHGDTQFPAWSISHIGGTPILEFPGVTQTLLDTAAKEARQKAYDIIACKEATYFGIAACAAALCSNIILDTKRVVPVSCFNESLDACLSMPAVLGKSGIEQILLPQLNEQEQQLLQKSAAALRSYF